MFRTTYYNIRIYGSEIQRKTETIEQKHFASLRFNNYIL